MEFGFWGGDFGFLWHGNGQRMKFIVGLLMSDIGSNPLTLWGRLVTVLMYMCELLRQIVSVSMNATSPWGL
jgi:hypothetical protein